MRRGHRGRQQQPTSPEGCANRGAAVRKLWADENHAEKIRARQRELYAKRRAERLADTYQPPRVEGRWPDGMHFDDDPRAARPDAGRVPARPPSIERKESAT